MAFYIKYTCNSTDSQDGAITHVNYYNEDGTETPLTTSSSLAHGYATEAAAQSVIDSNPTWISGAIAAATISGTNVTFTIEEAS